MKIVGRVVAGSKIGRTLGYPTANLAVPAGFDAVDGVYAARVRVIKRDVDRVASDGAGGVDDSGAERFYDAMANLGVKPTFSKKDGNEARILELHLFGFEGELYGRELTAELRDFIRPEQRFATPTALRTRIAKDEKLIKKILKCI